MKEKRTWYCCPVQLLLKQYLSLHCPLLQIVLSFLQSIELERKSKQLAEREFESSIRQKQSEIYSLGQRIKALSREKEIIAADSEDRVKLSLRKAELENLKKKHKKMQVATPF